MRKFKDIDLMIEKIDTLLDNDIDCHRCVEDRLTKKDILERLL